MQFILERQKTSVGWALPTLLFQLEVKSADSIAGAAFSNSSIDT
jgi:hypothetical protein